MKRNKDFIRPGILLIVLIALDQITKLLAGINLNGTNGFTIINKVFKLQYLENQSAAFSIDPVTLLNNVFHFKAFENPAVFLRTKMIFFVILTAVVLGIIIWIYTKIPNDKRFRLLNITIEVFVAGAIGNCIDRIWHNYVIDFLYFELIDFPIFNVADIYVTCSAIAAVILLLFYYKEDDFKIVFPRKEKEKKKN